MHVYMAVLVLGHAAQPILVKVSPLDLWWLQGLLLSSDKSILTSTGHEVTAVQLQGSLCSTGLDFDGQMQARSLLIASSCHHTYLHKQYEYGKSQGKSSKYRQTVKLEIYLQDVLASATSQNCEFSAPALELRFLELP